MYPEASFLMVSQNSLGKYIVGAYATSPNLFSWDEDIELKYYNMLKELKSIRGLELPFWGKDLHPFDDEWLLSNLEPKWENVLTCVPGTMKKLENNPYFGLASKNQMSRKDAIKFYSKAHSCIEKLKGKFGPRSVIAIFITSSPIINNKQVNAEKEAFISSLNELASWDWGNTKVLIEHCDAYNEKNTKPKKGFLSIKDEIDAIKQTNELYKTNFGIIINWGRSVIEHRNINGPLKHIKSAMLHNVLDGLMFSGTTANDNNLYGAWSDLHMPPASYPNFKYFEQESLMSYDNIKTTLEICDYSSLYLIGIKLLSMPKNSSLHKRVCINNDTMTIMDKIINEIN